MWQLDNKKWMKSAREEKYANSININANKASQGPNDTWKIGDQTEEGHPWGGVAARPQSVFEIPGDKQSEKGH